MDNDTLKLYLDHLSFQLISPGLFPNGPFSELFIKKRMLLKCVDISTFNPKDALRKCLNPTSSQPKLPHVQSEYNLSTVDISRHKDLTGKPEVSHSGAARCVDLWCNKFRLMKFKGDDEIASLDASQYK